MNNKTILVIGATGNQGGAVLRALQAKTKFRIRAFVRATDNESLRITTFRDQGVEIATGDLDDVASLTAAMSGVYGVFCVLNFQNGGIAKEEERGKRIADLAKTAGVQHFIYSSVGGAERNSGVPHFESKWHIEEHIRKIGLPYSIMRPTTFMTNLMEQPTMMRFVALSMSRGSITQKGLQMIAVEDIGNWVAHMFANPSTYLGKAVEIAGDEVTFQQMVAAYTKVYSTTPKSMYIPGWLFSAGDIGKMFTWIRKKGYKANIPALRKEMPGLLTFEQFVAQKKPV